MQSLKDTPFQTGYNAMDDRIENLIDAGVIDPAKVRAPTERSVRRHGALQDGCACLKLSESPKANVCTLTCQRASEPVHAWTSPTLTVALIPVYII